MKNRLFDTTIQKIKYEVVKELVRAYDSGLSNEIYHDIPIKIMPGPKATLRCCVYKERAIIQERLKLAMGGSKDNANVVEVIDIACDECPINGVLITPACRGCISHGCADVCPKKAISINGKRVEVDKSKCIECGRCTQACPFNAIILQKRPCVLGCKANAINVDVNGKAVIDDEKCVGCGACVNQCPFGAISDKSYILDALDILKHSENNTKYKVYAVVSPSIAVQFDYAKVGQVVTGLKKSGFAEVFEAALGADVVLDEETNELKERGILTTSCCPSFVKFVCGNFPELGKYISHTPSPMVVTGKLIKSLDPTAKVVFIGPCAAKKFEYKQDVAKDYIDCVLSFEELQALIDARNIDVSSLECTPFDNASYFGRIFARSGGIAKGVTELCAERGVEVCPIAMSGLDECKKQLAALGAGKSPFNFFEGMACEGGCVNGALCLHHSRKNVADIDKFGETAKEKTVDNTVKQYKLATGADKKT